ncbi:MAG: HAD family hydrolase [Desulfobacteraceae bacterium]|nr:HAD family hydrolase [Desulfobacteraceae bacterium]
MIEAVIFDLDDTLYPEWSYIKQGFWAVSEKLREDLCLHRKYSLNQVYEILENIFFNKTRFKIFNYLPEFIPEFEIDESYIANTLVPTFRFAKKRLECYPDVKSTLNQLRGTVKIGMLTNGNANVQNCKIDLLKIRKYFDKIEISGNYSEEKAKPSTFMLRKILDIFEVKPHNAIYLGDNPETDRCAIDIGCNFLRIIRKHGMHNDHSYITGIYHSINSLSELPYYIKNYQTIFDLS